MKELVKESFNQMILRILFIEIHFGNLLENFKAELISTLTDLKNDS